MRGDKNKKFVKNWQGITNVIYVIEKKKHENILSSCLPQTFFQALNQKQI